MWSYSRSCAVNLATQGYRVMNASILCYSEDEAALEHQIPSSVEMHKYLLVLRRSQSHHHLCHLVRFQPHLRLLHSENTHAVRRRTSILRCCAHTALPASCKTIIEDTAQKSQGSTERVLLILNAQAHGGWEAAIVSECDCLFCLPAERASKVYFFQMTRNLKPAKSHCTRQLHTYTIVPCAFFAAAPTAAMHDLRCTENHSDVVLRFEP